MRLVCLFDTHDRLFHSLCVFLFKCWVLRKQLRKEESMDWLCFFGVSGEGQFVEKTGRDDTWRDSFPVEINTLGQGSNGIVFALSSLRSILRLQILRVYPLHSFQDPFHLKLSIR